MLAFYVMRIADVLSVKLMDESEWPHFHKAWKSSGSFELIAKAQVTDLREGNQRVLEALLVLDGRSGLRGVGDPPILHSFLENIFKLGCETRLIAQKLKKTRPRKKKRR